MICWLPWNVRISRCKTTKQAVVCRTYHGKNEAHYDKVISYQATKYQGDERSVRRGTQYTDCY
jgi:hypothetical protein